MSDWKPIDKQTPRNGRVILTIHEKDLFPVAAFCLSDFTGKEYWLRQTDGPEDMHGPGKWESLYRTPTHWMPLPPHPSK